MATIRFFQPSEHDFVPTRELASEASRGSEAGREGTAIRFRYPGSESEAQLFEVRCEPNLEIPVHAHAEDEIIVVVDGELHFGARVCCAGASVYIPGHTLYGFRAGPAGATFLNFRPRADGVYLSRDEFLALKSNPN